MSPKTFGPAGGGFGRLAERSGERPSFAQFEPRRVGRTIVAVSNLEPATVVLVAGRG